MEAAMQHTLSHAVLAAEGLPYDAVLSRLAYPLGITVFIGGPYLLLRSNLGTKRAYLVLATSLFGFLFLLGLFWAFGAPGTPAGVGPTNLPGTTPNEYQPVWTPFAEDSTIAATEPYASAVAGGFGAVPDAEAANVETGVNDVRGFFGDVSGGERIAPSWVEQGDPEWTVADNGFPVVRQTFVETVEFDESGEVPADFADEGLDVGDVVPDGGSFVGYAFFDAGNPLFPNLVLLGLFVGLFVLHAVLLHVDEQAERRDRLEAVVEEREQVSAGV